MHIDRALLVTLFVLQLGVAAQAQTTVASATSGQFAISPSGRGTYRNTIQVQPGILGLELRLAQSVNNQAGDGFRGMGRYLESMSAISRRPKNKATDGVRGGVKYNVDDRFFLDGQRLISVLGAYDGGTCRTEISSFRKIKAAGRNAVNGPASLAINTKAGLTIKFGNTADARAEAQRKTVVRTWANNKITDAVSSYLAISYTEPIFAPITL